MKVLKSAWKLLIVIILVGLGILYYASNKVDAEYQSAIKAMNNGEWSRAVSLIAETPHYKDASELYIYMYPHKLFYSNYTTEADAIKGYNSAAEFIKSERDKLKGTNSEKYISELNELEKVLNFKITELNAKILDEPVKKNLDEGVELIKQGNYQEALLKLQSVGNDSIYVVDKQELIKYISLLTIMPSNNLKAITEVIAQLNPNYSGALSQEIKLTVQGFVDEAKWVEIYTAKNGTDKINKDTNKNLNAQQDAQKPLAAGSKSVTTGMKREEVIAILGNPASSNKISNKYGNYEEMTYSSNRFVYLENNTVTAVK